MSKLVKQLQHGPVDKAAGSPIFQSIDDLLGYYAQIAPGRNAILATGGMKVTYRALRVLVDEAVGELRSFGVSPRDRVAVVLPAGPETVVAILAAATAAVCVPLNPSFTADEWQRYFGDLQVTALLTRADMDSASRGVAHSLGIPVIDLSPHPRKAPCAFELLGLRSPCTFRNELAPGGDKDAFILMTSGTTSRPKLVPLTHASVCRSAYNAGAVLQLGPRDRLLNVLPLFHAHGLISALLSSLAAGSTVICTPGFDPTAFFNWLTEFRPTWYTAVPSIHRALLSEATHRKLSVYPSSLRIIRSASASLPPDVLRNLESLFGVPVIETYGMTEAASQIAANPLKRRKPGSVGQSAGAEIAIMNHGGRRLKAGERGEIALRGPTIMRRYDNDVAATESAFRDGWFRTGDLGYLDRDGYLFIVGRLKDVIKRGGQQVAPAEVEETLLRHPDVVEAVAFAIPHGRLGEDVAVAVVLRTDTQVSAQALRNFARERLARFKLPGLIQIVREIPKNPAGKVKRSELAAALSMTQPSARVNRCRKIVAPRSELEWQLAKTWADLLEINQIGVDQDVFALGADSLTVTQMLSRLRTHLGVDFSFKDVFDFPTVATLANHIESAGRNLPAVSPTLHDKPVHARSIRLSFQQQRIHVLSKLDPTGHNYHVVEAVLLSGPLDVDALEASIAMICERQEVLRSTFLEASGEPLQTVGTARPQLARFDLRTCDKIERAVTVQRQARESLRQSFDLEKELPLRVQLLWLDKDDHALVITLHHLVTDGWSQRLFWKELEALYRAKVSGAPVGLPELPIQYRHFVEWQREWLGTRAAEEQLGYWRARLEGLSELPLRTDRNRPERWTGRGARHPLKFSGALSRAIKSLSREHRVTLFMTLLAAFQCLLYRYTRHEDVAVGSVIANRNQIKIENLVGMFANTIILRTNLTGDPSFSEVLRRVRQVTIDAYRNQDLPLEEILRALQVPRSVDRNALFQVMFVLQNPTSRALTLPGLFVQSVDVDPGIARVDLMLELIDGDERLSGWFEYSTDLFEAATMARMATHFRTLLEAIVANPERRISRLPILPAWERRRVLVDWNDTHTSLPHGTFLDRFANQVCSAPNEIAVSAGQVRLSYRELARRSSAIADRLTMKGVGPDVIVILLAERGIDFLAAMIAVQGAGGAFLPLDPKIPAARLATIIHHSRTPLLLAGPGCAAALEGAISAMPTRARPQVLSLAKLLRAGPRNRARPARPAPSSLAYVIYTSGSTGVPKGAMIEQRGFTNHLFSKIFDLRMSASDVVAQTAPQSFDISIWQFLAALMVGGRVHIFADDEVRDPVLLAQVVSREKVTVLQIVPSLLRTILDRTPNESIARALSRLRWLICIGEPLAPDVTHNWQRLFPGVPLINAYGPAECSDTVATHRLAAPLSAPLGAVPIGRAIANTRLYVLDAHMQPVPIGVVGELCVGGTGVGRGYLNDPEQTRRSFLRDPFAHRRRARLYRTGDLARWRADGILEFIGRVDHQVKVRGYRIELEEIERVLLLHPDIRAAAVVLSRDDVGGGAQLVAHIVAAGRWGQKMTELRDFLKMRLPEYMIPMGFILLDCLPLTAHGKVDRRALAATREGLKVAASDFTAPRDSTEELLANIWADLLVIKNIGVFDNFFDLGGHSLLAGRVLSRVADAFGVSLPLRTLFEAPRISSLAERVKEARETQSHEPVLEIAHLPVKGPHRASVVQEHVLKIERELPGLPQFNLPFAFRLQGALDIPALEQSLAELVRRHDSLRTGFAWVDEVPVALVAPADDFDSSLSVEDLTGRTRTGKRAKALLVKKAALQAQQEAWTPFEIGRAPLFRTRLLRINADDHILILILHHIIVDGWSIGVLMEDLSEFYSAFTTGRRVPLPERVLQYSDFARWQRQWLTGDAANRQFAYWKDRLRNASPVFATTDNPGSALLSSRTAHEPIRFENELAARLNVMSHRLGATLFMTLLAGFNTLLLAHSGRNDVCVGTAMANRTQLRTEHVIGPLANTVVIRTRIDVDLSFLEALSRVRNSVLDAYARQELPFEILAARLAEEDGSDPGSLIQVFFILQNAFRPLELPNVTVQSFAYPDGQRVLPIDRIWLSVMLKETPSGIDGLCSYKQDLFGPNTLREWMSEYQSILAKAAANPEMSLGRLADR